MRVLVIASLLLAALSPLPAAGARLTRGPYLQQATPTSVTVVWRTAEAGVGTVRYGESPDALTQSASGLGPATQHEVSVEGLGAHTRYYYAVAVEDEVLAGGDETFHFVTSPPVGSSTRFRAWILGDSGTGDAAQAAARDGMLRRAGHDSIDLLLHMGDMAYSDGKDGEFQERFFEPYFLQLRNTVTWPTLGNHEGRSSTSGDQSGPYYDAYVLPRAAEAGGTASGTEAYYSYDWANVHFVVLDSHDSPREPDGAMLTWLAADLAATDQDWIIAYWHHPPYSKGSHDSDTEGQLVEMRENALPILEAAGVDLVLAGHSHIYERSYLVQGAYATPTVADGHVLDSGDGKPGGDGPYRKSPTAGPRDGAVYVVAGHGGARISSDGTHPLMYFMEEAHGSCLLDVEGNRLTLTNIRHDAEVTDHFTLVKGDSLLLTSPNGGERIAAGASQRVSWSTFGTVDEVVVEWSADDGATWTELASGIGNPGTWTWTVPETPAERARLRVRDPSGAIPGDQSDGTFTVYVGADPGRPNNAPVVLPIAEVDTGVDQLVILQLRAVDPDGDEVRFRADPLPESATLVARGGLFTWVPAPEDAGVWEIRLIAVDPGGAEGSTTLRVLVRDEDGELPPRGGTDAGSGDGGPPDPGDGKSCSAAPGGAALAVALLLVLLAVRRRHGS